jgi:16S rRNA (adenine1518-N6/adenine1519-N6)-dimethyltransferase
MLKSTSRSRTRRRWGQNFLVDDGAAEAILAAFRPSADDRVVEIGPGDGALTRRLIGRVGRLRAVEVDPALAERLEQDLDLTGGDAAIVRGDILAIDLAALLDDIGAGPDRPARVIANLPYNIATAVILKLLREGRLLRTAASACSARWRRASTASCILAPARSARAPGSIRR